jgi:predicted RNA-binding protein with PUA-like domain
MNYWIFKANPDLYDVEEHIRDNNPPTAWKVSRYGKEMKAGDVGFIWRTGLQRGVIAIVELLSDPYYVEVDPIQPYWSEKTRVDLRVTDHFPVLEAEFLKVIPGLGNLSTFHGFQAATNFRVTPAEGEIICKLIANSRRV